MVMVLLEGGQREVRGAPPPLHHPKLPHLDPPPPEPSGPPPPSHRPSLSPPLQCFPPPPPWGPSAHFYSGGGVYKSEETAPAGPCSIEHELLED